MTRFADPLPGHPPPTYFYLLGISLDIFFGWLLYLRGHARAVVRGVQGTGRKQKTVYRDGIRPGISDLIGTSGLSLPEGTE